MAEKTSKVATIGFDGRVEKIGDRAIVRFPAAASAKLPSRGQVAVEATLNGHAFATMIEPDGKRGHWLSIDDCTFDEGATVTVEPGFIMSVFTITLSVFRFTIRPITIRSSAVRISTPRAAARRPGRPPPRRPPRSRPPSGGSRRGRARPRAS